jgi:hypothetical protein
MPDDEERPKKTWRERDKGRDRSKHVSTSADRERERFERTPAYTRYKQGLERVFSGGELSEGLRDKLDPSGANKEKDKKLRAIREAEGTVAFAKALDEVLAGYDFPDDAFLLDRALEHPRVEIQIRALERLLALREAGKLAKPPPSLKVRLEGLRLNSPDSDVCERAEALQKKL